LAVGLRNGLIPILDTGLRLGALFFAPNAGFPPIFRITEGLTALRAIYIKEDLSFLQEFIVLKALVFSLLFATFFCNSALATKDPAALRTSFSYTPVYQFETDVDSGGSFAVERHFLHLDFLKPIDRQTQVGLGVHLDFEHWDFNDAATVLGATPWQEIQRPSLSLSVFHSPSKNWRIFFAPTIGVATTELANSGDSLVYGAAFSLIRSINQDLSLGLGIGAFERLEKTGIYPFVVINWKITDKLSLKNPFSAGPVGPAGLELVYDSGKRWKFGLGGAYRSYRFRLADDNSVSGGVGEVDFVAAFGRLAYNFAQRFIVDLSVGGLFSGEIGIEDAGGHSLGDSSYDTAPFVGLTFKGRF
jgi:hypothetical protein